MLQHSRRFFFYKKNSSKPFVHPSRRWVPFYAAGGVLAGVLGYSIVRYALARLEANRPDIPMSGAHLCSTSVVDFMTLLPSNLISHAAGVLATANVLDERYHRYLISLLTWYYGISLEDCDPSNSHWHTLQEFYTRSWKPGSRPIDSKAYLVSPCDGEVIAVVDHVHSDTVVQVKGFSYSVHSLFRLRPPSPSPPERRRALIVFKMSMRDFHHVVAPTRFQCEGSIYVPGSLLPISQAWYRLVPGLVTLNERVVVHGTVEGSSAPLYLALIGSTLTGKITLAIDKRVRTNFLNPPEYSIFTKYQPFPLERGAKVGTFEWGSAVAMLVDIPLSSELDVKNGSAVKAGQPLTREK